LTHWISTDGNIQNKPLWLQSNFLSIGYHLAQINEKRGITNGTTHFIERLLDETYFEIEVEQSLKEQILEGIVLDGNSFWMKQFLDGKTF
jgi:hypothetical protein